MDSIDFRRRVLPDPRREETDEILARALRWVGENAPPSYVYTQAQLDLWATQHGYAKQSDLGDIADLLRCVAPKVPAPSPLSTRVVDAIFKFGGTTT